MIESHADDIWNDHHDRLGSTSNRLWASGVLHLSKRSALAPVWCRNFSNVGTKTCGRFKTGSERGKVLDCQLSQSGGQLSRCRPISSHVATIREVHLRKPR